MNRRGGRVEGEWGSDASIDKAATEKDAVFPLSSRILPRRFFSIQVKSRGKKRERTTEIMKKRKRERESVCLCGWLADRETEKKNKSIGKMNRNRKKK